MKIIEIKSLLVRRDLKHGVLTSIYGQSSQKHGVMTSTLNYAGWIVEKSDIFDVAG